MSGPIRGLGIEYDFPDEERAVELALTVMRGDVVEIIGGPAGLVARVTDVKLRGRCVLLTIDRWSLRTRKTVDVRDEEFKDHLVTRVERGESRWEVFAHGAGAISVPDTVLEGFVPMAGMWARFYGVGEGGRIRGLVLDGHVVWYRTQAEEARLLALRAPVAPAVAEPNLSAAGGIVEEGRP
jgi:hypothetical protein